VTAVRAAIALALGAFGALLSPTAQADPPPASARPDSSDGRIEGDVAAVIGVGATVAPRGLRGAVDGRLRFLDTAGVFATYEEGAAFSSSAQPARVLAVGVEVRPLFLGRWLNDLEWGKRRLDLLLDSFGLEIGACFAQPAHVAFDSSPGLQAGIGVEVPILARASGPWIGLHGGARWGPSALAGAPAADPNDRSLFVSITLAYHQLFVAHLVDIGDEASR
jgi:hypothetical protein